MLEPLPRLDCSVRPQGEPARLLEQLSFKHRVVREGRCLLVVAPSFCGRANGACALACASEHLARFRLDRWSILRVGGSLEGGQVMRGEHLGHSVLLSKGLLKMCRGSQVSALALSFGQRLVG